MTGSMSSGLGWLLGWLGFGGFQILVWRVWQVNGAGMVVGGGGKGADNSLCTLWKKAHDNGPHLQPIKFGVL